VIWENLTLLIFPCLCDVNDATVMGVSANAGPLCDKAAVLGATIKERLLQKLKFIYFACI